MAKSPVLRGNRSPKKMGNRHIAIESEISASVEKASRIDRLVAIADHCTAAQALAESLNEAFLVHLLAMVIQEARTTMSGHGADAF